MNASCLEYDTLLTVAPIEQQFVRSGPIKSKIPNPIHHLRLFLESIKISIRRPTSLTFQPT